MSVSVCFATARLSFASKGRMIQNKTTDLLGLLGAAIEKYGRTVAAVCCDYFQDSFDE